VDRTRIAAVRLTNFSAGTGTQQAGLLISVQDQESSRQAYLFQYRIRKVAGRLTLFSTGPGTQQAGLLILVPTGSNEFLLFDFQQFSHGENSIGDGA
jgi:hypothetical protein